MQFIHAFLAVVLLFVSPVAFSQGNDPCTAAVLSIGLSCSFANGTTVGSSSSSGIPAPGCAGYSGNDVWYRFTAPSNGTVTIDLNTGTMTDSGMAWYTGTTCSSLSLFQCDDNTSTNGQMSRIISNCLTPGETIWVRIWKKNGGTGSFKICASTVPGSAPTNSTCQRTSPICSGSPITFPALSGGSSAFVCDPGNNYSCLSTSPNPSWYYLEILNPGNLAINVSALSDIDFAFWGPFANLTAAKSTCGNLGAPIDCSYSTSPSEQANANNTHTGEVYMLVVTNYANTPQTITVATGSGSTATTNCAIVPLPVTLESFDAAQEGRDVALDWVTASEVNCDYFLVERTKDGQVWQTVGMVAGSGTTKEKHSYQFNDKVPGSGIFYYRLKTVDLDASFTRSDVISVEVKIVPQAKLYPQPSNGFFQVSLSGTDIATLHLYSLAGQEMPVSFTLKADEAMVDCSHLQPGMYTINVRTTDGTSVQERVLIER